MNDYTTPIGAFLDAAAAKQPAPGGGAVAALAGALAASMGEMVMNYSVGKKDLAAFDDANGQTLRALTDARQMLLQLMVQDEAAFTAYTAAKKEKKPLHDYALDCVRVPQAIGEVADGILSLAGEAVERSNRWLLSDLAVCGELAMATIRCAIHNINANLGDLTPEEVETIRDQNADLLAGGIDAVTDLMKAVRQRQAM